jgi:hypothetical protein
VTGRILKVKIKKLNGLQSFIKPKQVFPVFPELKITEISQDDHAIVYTHHS